MWIDFKTAKKLCTMEQLLARYNVKLRAIGGDTLRGKCPLPTHSSGNSGDSFSVSRNKNIWSCKSESCIANSGRKGGNVLDFVATMEQCELPAAAAKLVEWFGPVEKEKAAPHMEKRPDAPQETSPGASSNGKSSAENGKRYMKQVDDWWAKLIECGDQEEDADYWKRVLNGVKAKLLESYKNGKVAVQAPG